MPKTRRRVTGVIIAVVIVLASMWVIRTPRFGWLLNRLQGEKTVEERLAQYGPKVRPRLAGDFMKAGVPYPPAKLIFVGLKHERTLRVYASSPDGVAKYIGSYPILAASGHIGPKLEEGDGQVPEGIYRVTFLNPNSLCHLSLRLDYPNTFDRAMAKKDGRTKLGGDIMIHGNRCSVGCIAVGDKASEDLFVLAADTGIRNIKVIISPVDLRTAEPDPGNHQLPKWTRLLYSELAEEMKKLPEPPR